MTKGAKGKKKGANKNSFITRFKEKFCQKHGFAKMVHARTIVVLLVLCLGFLAVIGMMAKYAIVERDKWQGEAIAQQQRDIELPAMRGAIYDNNMELLVQSAPAWSVYISDEGIPEELRDSVLTSLAGILDTSTDYLWERLDYCIKSETLHEVKLSIKADINQRDDINALIASTLYDYDEDGVADEKKEQLRGIKLSSDTQRYYFQGSLASHVLGFANSDNVGVYGVEAYYDEALSGVPGRVVTVKNAIQGNMPTDMDQTVVEAQEGNSLVLTIDADIQKIVEKYLAQAVEDNKVRNRACAIVMDVNTGAILAMATMPDYDPANRSVLTDRQLAAQIAAIVDDDERSAAKQQAWAEQWSNKAVSDSYEPGSVFKPITMAAGLEEGKTSLSDSFFCPGYKVMGTVKRSCHKTAGHGSESLSQAMMNSCNPVFMTIAERLGGSLFYKYYEAFGFTERTGIDLPNENTPVAGATFHTESSLQNAANLGACSFGQANTVSPIQLVTAIAAVTNGGYLVTPHVVDSIIDDDGNLVEKIDTEIKRQVISQATSDAINKMLEQTVSGGTARNGYVAGYRVGGKTGTSEKLKATSDTGERAYVASYCAIAPSDDPQIVMLVMLDEPTGTSHMGGTIAAPVARNVLTEVLPYLGIDSILTSEEASYQDVLVPDVVGLPVEEAKTMLQEKGFTVRILGSGSSVVDQAPSLSNVPKGSKIILSTDLGSAIENVTVPDVHGMTPAQANSAIVGMGLNICYSGTGYDSSDGEAIGQSPAAGESVKQGSVVKVEFIMSGATD